jgi:hypothetical protein
LPAKACATCRRAGQHDRLYTIVGNKWRQRRRVGDTIAKEERRSRALAADRRLFGSRAHFPTLTIAIAGDARANGTWMYRDQTQGN